MNSLTNKMIGALERESDIVRRMEDLPAPSRLLSEKEFLDLTGLALDCLEELVQLDWFNCVKTSETVLFKAGDVMRARKLGRLCSDFELSPLGGSIVVDLLERIAELESEVHRLRGLL